VEPFIPHAQSTEFYICFQSVREGELIMFHHEGSRYLCYLFNQFNQGGVDVGDVDEKAKKLLVPTGQLISPTSLKVGL
jgi:ATP citrate (pro-S)-lyase